ncbi:hypothetical protein [Maribellus luteus]|uniref:hypothetical protein n=1 Tax=Maribellus luteus TaxID=2305463 RepID=UPI0012D71998|nr:hypothetical protein [Maribellus luteus]
MKKIFLILALVAVYGVSIANSSTNVASTEKDAVTIVADDDNNSAISEEEKDKKKTEKKKAEVKEKDAKKATGCTETQKKSCAASGKTCGSEKQEAPAKKGCCGTKK